MKFLLAGGLIGGLIGLIALFKPSPAATLPQIVQMTYTRPDDPKIHIDVIGTANELFTDAELAMIRQTLDALPASHIEKTTNSSP